MRQRQRDSNFAFCLDNGEFLEFVPEHQKIAERGARLWANYGPIDRLASYMSNYCTRPGLIKVIKYFNLNSILMLQSLDFIFCIDSIHRISDLQQN